VEISPWMNPDWCKMSVLMGVPLSMNRNEVSTPLPAFSSSPHMAATLAIHVKLSQALSEVSNSEIPPHLVQITADANMFLYSNLWASNQGHFREENAKSAQSCRGCSF
jgi:hypothetical protein